MSSHERAHARARAAVAQEIAAVSPETAYDVAGDVLALLGRMGWRWVSQHAPEPSTRQPAPPPAEWRKVREQIRDRVHTCPEDGAV